MTRPETNPSQGLYFYTCNFSLQAERKILRQQFRPVNGRVVTVMVLEGPPVSSFSLLFSLFSRGAGRPEGRAVGSGCLPPPSPSSLGSGHSLGNLL